MKRAKKKEEKRERRKEIKKFVPACIKNLLILDNSSACMPSLDLTLAPTYSC